MQKAQRASFESKHEEETVRLLILIHKINGELNLLKFNKIKSKRDKLPEITRSW